MVACLAVGSQGGYKPKCRLGSSKGVSFCYYFNVNLRTIYETAYTTQYEQSCSTSYKTECSTSYQQQCSTEYQTEYERKVCTLLSIRVWKKITVYLFQVFHQLRRAMLHQLRDFLWGEVFNHLQRGLLLKKANQPHNWNHSNTTNFSRFAPLAMADTVDMESNVRKFPHRAVSKSQFRSPWTSVSRSQKNLVQRWVPLDQHLYSSISTSFFLIRSQFRSLFRTVSRFQRRTANRSQCRTVSRFLSRRRPRWPDRSVADVDTIDLKNIKMKPLLI